MGVFCQAMWCTPHAQSDILHMLYVDKIPLDHEHLGRYL